MATTTLTAQQKLESFDDLVASVIGLVCEASMVHIDELLGGSKKKEVANARSVVCVVLRDSGYTYKSISDILDVDVSISHTYAKSHGNRMADNQYSSLYNKVKRMLNSVGDTDEDLRVEVSKLKVLIHTLDERIAHIYQLLTRD